MFIKYYNFVERFMLELLAKSDLVSIDPFELVNLLIFIESKPNRNFKI